MKKYESYKESGIKWLGEIPSHWDVIPLKFNLSLKGRIGWNGLKSDEFKENSYAYLVTGQDFDKADIDWTKCYQIDKDRYDEDPFIQLSNGDLLVTKDGTIGKVAKVSNLDKPACLNSGIFVVKQIKNAYIQDFLYWTFVSNQLLDFNNFNSSGSTIQHLYQNVFENMPLVMPSILEQERISSYLNYKVGQIDRVIEEKQKMLEDINAYRSSFITEIVTKGLKKNILMKESGVASIGEIPNTWKVVPIKYVLDSSTNGIKIGPFGSTLTGKVSSDNTVKVYGQWNVIGKDFNAGKNFVSEQTYQELESYWIHPNDILISMMGTVGKCAIIPNGVAKGIMDSHIVKIRLNESVIIPRYFYYVYDKDVSSVVMPQIQRNRRGSIMDGLNSSLIKNFYIPLPSLNEQKAISDYLDKKTESFESIIFDLQSQIEDMKCYKSSVIAEAVTGKVDLREWKNKNVKD